MLNRRHIRTVVIQSVYSNSHELIKKKELKSYLKRTSSSTLDLFYCMIDYLKEIHLFFNNIESQKFSCPYINNNKYLFFFLDINLFFLMGFLFLLFPCFLSVKLSSS